MNPWDNVDQRSEVLTKREDLSGAIERPLLVPIKEVCRMLGVSRSTVDRMVKDGEDLGMCKVRGRVMFRTYAVEEWAMSQ